METYLYQDLYELEEKHWWHRAKREICIKLISKFNLQKNPKILDIGCGTGKNIEEFLKIGEAWGIDNNKKALNFCKLRKIKTARLGKADNTGFLPQSFDIVTILDVLEHVDDKKCLNEIFRILKPNGLLIATVPALPMLWSRWDEVLHHKRRYIKEDLLLLININNNFKVLEVSYMYSFLVIPVILIRMIKSKLSKEEYQSDFRLSNNFINYFMLFLTRIEAFMMDYLPISIGTSLIIAARKK